MNCVANEVLEFIYIKKAEYFKGIYQYQPIYINGKIYHINKNMEIYNFIVHFLFNSFGNIAEALTGDSEEYNSTSFLLTSA